MYMRQKIVDERVGVWKVFGEHPDGTVDVTDNDHDVFVSMPRELADRVIAAHDLFRDHLYEILSNMPTLRYPCCAACGYVYKNRTPVGSEETRRIVDEHCARCPKSSLYQAVQLLQRVAPSLDARLDADVDAFFSKLGVTTRGK